MARVEKPLGCLGTGRSRRAMLHRRPDRAPSHAAAGPPVTRFLPTALARVHRAVGADHQLVGRRPVVRIARRRRSTATARPTVSGRSTGIASTPMPDLLGEDVGAGRIGLGQEDDELVAAVAGGRIDAPDAGRDDVADAAQHAVAVEVADRSLMVLSSSRSIISRQNPRPERALRAISRSRAAKKKPRLNSPVSGSMVDRRMAASRVRRCSRAMTIAAYASRISARQVDPDGRGRRRCG